MKNEIIKEAVQEKKIVLFNNTLYKKLFATYSDMMTGDYYYAFIIICAIASLVQLWDFLHLAGLVFILIWFIIFIGLLIIDLYYQYTYNNYTVYFITPNKEKVLHKEWSVCKINIWQSIILVIILVITFIIPFALSQSIIDGTGWASALIFAVFIVVNYAVNHSLEHFFPNKYLVSSSTRFTDLSLLLA